MGKLTDLNSDTIPYLYALASKLEGEGQYNNAKLCRGLAEALTRQTAYAYQQQLSNEFPELADELSTMAETLTGLDIYPEMAQALENGAQALLDKRLALVAEAPHPFVCRTCGHLLLEQRTGDCPLCKARPQTFLRFPPVYWLDNFDPFQALQQLRQTPIDLAALLDGHSEDELEKTPEAGGWNIRNAVSHIRDAQGVLEHRLNLMIESNHPLLESKAVFEWAANEEERPPTTMEIYDTYAESRRRTLASLENLPLRDWRRSGEHEEFGEVTITQQVSYFATHELTHLPQIEALLP
jgi:rubrerythrin/uncharacterized damage-inducible protein DinB